MFSIGMSEVSACIALYLTGMCICTSKTDDGAFSLAVLVVFYQSGVQEMLQVGCSSCFSSSNVSVRGTPE